MGLLPRHLHLLAIEQKNHPIKGDVITFGQQQVYASLDDVYKIFSQHNVKLNDLPKGFNTKTKIPGDEQSRTNAETVLRLLGADNVYVADISDYENADFIIDLNEPIKTEYENRFDVVFDFGTLEHVFDIPTALTSIVRMLKPGGIVFLGSIASNAIDHGFYSLSPTLFFDFFAMQGFVDFNCYLCECSTHNLYLKSKVYHYDKVGGQFPIISPNTIEILFWARMYDRPENINKPNQSLFIKMWGNTKGQLVNEDDQSSFKLKKLMRGVKKLMLGAVELIPARIRPEFIDSTLFSIGTRFNKRDNMRFIGKF